MEARPYLKKVSIVMAFYYVMEKVSPDKLWQNREHFLQITMSSGGDQQGLQEPDFYQ
jgi:hypothetical protein